VSVLSTDQKKQLKKLQKRVPDGKAFKKRVANHLKVVADNLPDAKQLDNLSKTLNKRFPKQKQSHKGSIFGAILLIGAIGGLVYWAVKSGKLRDEDLYVDDATHEAKRKAQGFVSDVKGKVADVVDDVKDKAKDLTDKAQDKADDVADKAQDKTDELADKAQKKTPRSDVKDSVDKAADKASEATDKTADAVKTKTEEATAVVHEAAQKAKRS